MADFTTPSYRGKVPKEVEKTLDLIVQYLGTLSERLEESKGENRRQVEDVRRQAANLAGLIGARGQGLIGETATDPLLNQIPTGNGTVQSVSLSVSGNLSGSVATSKTTPVVTVSISTTPSFTSVTVGTAKCKGYTSSALPPGLGDYANDKDWGIHEDTGASKIYLVFNDSGTVKKVELT
jgi:hypothetical protein